MLEQLETLAQTARTELEQLDTGDTLSAWNSKYIDNTCVYQVMMSASFGK